MKWSFLALALCLALHVLSAYGLGSDTHFVSSLPGVGDVSDLNIRAGHIAFDADNDSKAFYLMSDMSQDAKSPFVIWLNGGPGASSMLGAFTENGPLTFSGDGKLERSETSWSKKACVVWIDQPVTVGYSTTSGPVPKTREEQTHKLLMIVTQFYKMYPSLLSRELFIFGESYGGTYVPYLAEAITDAMSIDQFPKVNFGGIAIGDGWFHPIRQVPSYPQYAYGTGLIDRNQYTKSMDWVSEFNHQLRVSNMTAASAAINDLQTYILDKAGKVSIDNILSDSIFEYIMVLIQLGKYLNQPEVQDALHVPGVHFNSLSDDVSTAMAGEQPKSSLFKYEALFAKQLPIVFYTGNMDMNCNHLGVSEALADMSIGSAIEAAERKVWHVGDDKGAAGYYKCYQNLSNIVVRSAGHERSEDTRLNSSHIPLSRMPSSA
eukprot:TRINITY_DN20144_c0_g1_i1.p1 TRINITY_DN20144_c0_g1~~TRINITY_DN20144_c0_g1_i1.p1  ORF type:complete len:433 (+),score=93.42 TRINITY_DN20144_c0_g1_i1:96-1394(+)